MAGYGKSKKGGFTGNLVKLGGSGRKLSLKSDMRTDSGSGRGVLRAR